MLQKNGIKDNLFKPDKKEKQVKIKKQKLEITDELNLIYDSKYSCSQHRNIKIYYNIDYLSQNIVSCSRFIID